ncbi:AAA family ATPase [Sinisalibacter aestuarii]|uniref:Adenylate kinase n=1 Tax=Sinisalibacter aestuarii TaxID=2949426 RepID=A0ABQ5LRU6_9RHOB|nr:AAA family ATPase [Sinisalibacter aestuarii]GKY86966.1 adenylate kinase [Sinisalibacter aestuarii]
MAGPKLHITGAACTGATTLGRHLAEALGVPLLDTDDFYWRPTDPPFTDKRPAAARIALMQEAMGEDGWIISGSIDGWGDPLLVGADLIVFLTAPTAMRLARLKARERRRFGERIAPGGDMEGVHANFLVWASQYDDTGFPGRSRLRHETWLAEQTVPVLRLDARQPPDRLAAEVLARLAEMGYGAGGEPKENAT